MIKILFVCHGNICRSPMAEIIMKDIVKKNHKELLFHIESRATSTEEIWNGRGNPIYPPAIKELNKHGLSGVHNAKQITKEDYDEYDYIICMDYNNIRNLNRMIPDIYHKVELLLGNKEVSDPWYTGDFSICYEDILRGCNYLFNRIMSKTPD